MVETEDTVFPGFGVPLHTLAVAKETNPVKSVALTALTDSIMLGVPAVNKAVLP